MCGAGFPQRAWEHLFQRPSALSPQSGAQPLGAVQHHVDQAFENGTEVDKYKLIPAASLGENKPEPGSAGSLTGRGNLHGELSAQRPCPGRTAGARL